MTRLGEAETQALVTSLRLVTGPGPGRDLTSRSLVDIKHLVCALVTLVTALLPA